jgi:hypothetical protein
MNCLDNVKDFLNHERQIEQSVVLASPRLSILEAARLIEDAGH